MSSYKKVVGWLAKTLSRRKPRKVVRQPERGYPFLGSLDANFQDYARKNLLPLKGWGIETPKKIVKPPVQRKTVTGKQLRIPGMKSGGSSLTLINKGESKITHRVHSSGV